VSRTPRSGRLPPLPLLPLLLLPLLAVVAVAAIATLAAAQIDPPGAGQDWVISNDVTVVSNQNIHIDGSIYVNSSSRLTLRNLTLTMDPATDGETGIYVEAGSRIVLTNVVVRSGIAANHYWFEIRGIGNITNCDIRDVASNTAAHDSWDTIMGGVQIYDSNTTVTGTKVHDCQRIAMYVKGASPLIQNCEFYNTEYVYTDKETGYFYLYQVGDYGYFSFLYTDATGLFLVSANPVIERCTFRNNGMASTAMGYYSTEANPNYLETWGRGVLCYDSSPAIGNCTFAENGLQPSDQVVSGITVHYLDGLRWNEYNNNNDEDLPMEGGLACLGSSAPKVNWSTILNNDLFGVVGSGGYPALINHTSVTGTQYVRGNSVYSPSAAIFIIGNGGNMNIENVQAIANVVVSNIKIRGPTALISNFSNSDNRVINGFNLELWEGTFTIANSSLNGDLVSGEGLQANIYAASNGNSAPKILVLDSTLRGGLYSMATSWNGMQATIINSTLTGAETGAFFLYQSTVDCIDCPAISPERADGPTYGGGSMVRIMYHASFQVRWQNGEPVNSAFLQVKNATQEFLYGGITNSTGMLGPVVLTSKTWLLTGGRLSIYSNSPIYAQAFASGLQSVQKSFVFTGPQLYPFAISIYDTKDPEIYIFSPTEDFAQNSTNITVYGMCLDIGAGVSSVRFAFDGGAWRTPAGVESWSGYAILKEGAHQLVVRTEDWAGNVVLKVVKNIVIDLTPPQLEVLDPVKDVWYSSAENYTVRGRTYDQSKLYVNGQLVEVAPDGSWAYTQELHSGKNEFTIRAVDRVGNVKEVLKTIVSDTSIPKLILTSPEDGMYTNISQVELKGITEVGAVVEINGEPIATYGGRFATTLFLTEGPNRLQVDAVDKAGNVMRVLRTVVLDSIPPVLRIESPLASGMLSTKVLDIRGVVDDPTVTKVVVNGLLVPVVDLRFSKPFRLDEGLNVIVVEAWDRAMNYASRTFRITLDTKPPAMQVVEPSGDIVTRDGTMQLRGRIEIGARFVITGAPRAVDNDLVIRLEDTFRYPEYTLMPGINTITFEATDAVGNVARIVRVVDYDLVPPRLILESLPLRTYREIIDVRGVLLNGTSVTIDKVPVVVGADGAFLQSVPLHAGMNPIVIKALDDAGNVQELQVNVTRLKVPEPARGILGAGAGASVALVVVMFVIGLAVLYPAFKARGEEPVAARTPQRPSWALAPSGAPGPAPEPRARTGTEVRRRPRKRAPPPPQPPPPQSPPPQSPPPQSPPWG
jgi:hypothetical protein